VEPIQDPHQDNTSDHGFAPQVGRSVSIDQAAQLLGVSRRTIYNRIRDGRLETVRTLGGSQRVVLDSLHEAARLNGDRLRN
jgi:excisionase family DNA binding protein